MTAILGYLAINVPAGTGLRQPAVRRDHGRADGRRGRRQRPPPDRAGRSTRSGSRSAAPVVARRPRARPRRDRPRVRRRPSPPRSGRRSSTSRRHRRSALAVGLLARSAPLAWLAFAGAARLGFGRSRRRPPPTSRPRSSRRPPPPPAAAWLRPGARLGLPVVWMVACLLVLPVGDLRRLVHPVGVRSRTTGLFAGLARTATPASRSSTYRGDVRLPQRPDARRTPRRRRGGPGCSTSSRSGSTRRASPATRRPRSTTPATSSSGGSACRPWLRRLAGLRAAEPAARPDRDRLRLPVGVVGPDRSGGRSSTTTTRACRSCSSASAYFLAELWHGASRRTWLLARLAAGGRDPRTGDPLGPRPAAVRLRRRRPGRTRTRQACPPIIPQFLLTTQTAALAVVVGVSVLVVIRLFGRLGGDGADPDDARRSAACPRSRWPRRAVVADRPRDGLDPACSFPTCR